MESKKITVIKYILLGFLALLAIMGRWIHRSFGEITHDQIIFHLNVPFLFEGIEPTFYAKFFRHCVLPFFAVMLLYFLARKFFFFKKETRYKYEKYFLMFLVVICLVVAQVFWHFDRLYSESKLARNYGNFYETHYVKPQKENLIFPQNKRNLIVIVLESMETTFGASNHPKRNPFGELTPRLSQIAKTNFVFSDIDSPKGGGKQAYGVGWTIAGLVGYYCAIPLRLPIDGNSFGKVGGPFLEGATCLGNILDEAGYNQASLVPHHKNFSGVGTFFQTHQIPVYDLNFFQSNKRLPEDYEGFWGIKDGLLFDLAKEELKRLSQKDKPFALYFLSIDTHSKVGYFDPKRCQAITNDTDEHSQYKNAISCSDYLVGDFIDWVQKQDFYPNTTIVILGDHLSMNADFFPKDTERRIYNTFINPKFFHTIQNTNNRSFSHFDMLPTILDSLGVEVKGGKLGLGVDLLSNQPTLLETGDFEKAILQRSKMYENFLYGTQNYP